MATIELVHNKPAPATDHNKDSRSAKLSSVKAQSTQSCVKVPEFNTDGSNGRFNNF